MLVRTVIVAAFLSSSVAAKFLRRPLDYTNGNILSAPDQDDSDAAVAANFQGYPTVNYDPVAFGQRYQGQIIPYPNLPSQPYYYPEQPSLPTLASGFNFNAYAPFNAKISTYWISRLGLANAKRMFREDVGIAVWDTAAGIDVMVKVTDVDDNLAINDIIIEPYMAKVVQNYQGADPVPVISNCLWYFAKTWYIAPRPWAQQSLPILQPALYNSVRWMYEATQEQWDNNIAFLKSIDWPGVDLMQYGIIGDEDPSIVNTNFPPDINIPRITFAQVLANSGTYGTN